MIIRSNISEECMRQLGCDDEEVLTEEKYKNGDYPDGDPNEGVYYTSLSSQNGDMGLCVALVDDGQTLTVHRYHRHADTNK